MRAGPARRADGRLRRLVVQPAAEQHRAAAAPQPRSARRAAVRGAHRRGAGAHPRDELTSTAPIARSAPLVCATWRSTRNCSRSSRAREDKGPLLYFADEQSLYNPRLQRRYRVLDGDIPDLLIDDAETVDDAEHARLTQEGRERRHQADVRAVTADIAQLPRRGRGAARAARRRARGRGRRCTPTRSRAADAIRNIVVLGMGGSGIVGRRRRGRVQRRAAGAGHGAEADPHARVRRARDARVRGVVLGRHRGDGVDGVERGRTRRAARRDLVRRRARRASRATRARCTSRAPTGSCRVPRSARSSRRCSSRCSASGSRRARTRTS